jgi:hypothetical protein
MEDKSLVMPIEFGLPVPKQSSTMMVAALKPSSMAEENIEGNDFPSISRLDSYS